MSKLLIFVCLLAKFINCEKCKNQCENFVISENDPSIFLQVADGRLGNHLMVFSTLFALGQKLKIRPYVQRETANYLKHYFEMDDIPVFEDTFCNSNSIKPFVFDQSLDSLIKRKELHKGHIIHLWPKGYKVS